MTRLPGCLGLAWLVVLALTGCGQPAPSGAPWRAVHADPPGFSFLEQGQLGGVCAISVHYPDEAPSAIRRGGLLYLQRDRSARGGSPGNGEPVAARSGDWTLLTRQDGGYALLTASERFEYELKSTC